MSLNKKEGLFLLKKHKMSENPLSSICVSEAGLETKDHHPNTCDQKKRKKNLPYQYQPLRSVGPSKKGKKVTSERRKNSCDGLVCGELV